MPTLGLTRDWWKPRTTALLRDPDAVETRPGRLSQDRGVQPHARQDLSMPEKPISPLRQRMIDDMMAADGAVGLT